MAVDTDVALVAEVSATQARVTPEADPVEVPEFDLAAIEAGSEPDTFVAPAVVELSENLTAELDVTRSRLQTLTSNTQEAREQDRLLASSEEAARDEMVENQERLANAEQLQAEYQSLRESGLSQAEALGQLLSESDNPEHRSRLTQILANISALENALPGKSEVVSRLIENSNLDLGASNATAVFADFMAQAEASEDLTEEDVEQLRTVLAGSDEAIRTGTDFEDAMNERVLDEEGNEIPAHTADEPLDFGVGLEGFTSDDGAQQFMRATPEHGQGVTLEVTHLSPEEKAVLASYLDTWRMTEEAGASEWLLSLTQYDLHGQNIVDPIQLIEAAQVVNAVYGGLAGYNGEVLRGPEQLEMIQWQAQLASPKGDAARSDRNPTMTASAMVGLGIQDENGNLDLDVLQAFGEYSRENWFSAPDYEAVQAHLQGLFPEKFERPNAPAVGRGSSADLAA